MGKVTRIVDTCDICGIESLNKIPLCPSCKKQVCAMCSTTISIIIHFIQENLYATTSNKTSRHKVVDNFQLRICNNCKEKINNQIIERIKKILEDYND